MGGRGGTSFSLSDEREKEREMSPLEISDGVGDDVAFDDEHGVLGELG